jgi:succinate-semialdehyde dehydrogenase / glutarate-semialdehyde dehydrogenase
VKARLLLEKQSVNTQKSEPFLSLDRYGLKIMIIKIISNQTNVGQILLKQSASTVKKVSLELGGLAPFIVFESADLATAAKALIAAKFRNTGQTCIAANNVFVHRSVMSEFIEIFKFEIARLKFGDVFDSSTTVGKIKKVP